MVTVTICLVFWDKLKYVNLLTDDAQPTAADSLVTYSLHGHICHPLPPPNIEPQTLLNRQCI